MSFRLWRSFFARENKLRTQLQHCRKKVCRPVKEFCWKTNVFIAGWILFIQSSYILAIDINILYILASLFLLERNFIYYYIIFVNVSLSLNWSYAMSFVLRKLQEGNVSIDMICSLQIFLNNENPKFWLRVNLSNPVFSPYPACQILQVFLHVVSC